jgi:hypothetical protein
MKTYAPLLFVFLAAACGMAESEEERAVHVAREYLRATDRGHFERSWDLCSTRRKALWDEVRDVLVGVSTELPVRPYADAVRPIFVQSGVVPTSGREAYLLVVGNEERETPIAAGPPEIERDGDQAVVRYAVRNLAIGLRREDGEWRIDAMGPADRGGVWVDTLASGREIAWWGWADLEMKEIERVPLPEVPGGQEPDCGARDLPIRVIVHEDGRYEIKGRICSPARIVGRLQVFAERKMDMEHPEQPSVIPLSLAAHRGAPWPAVRGLLEACAHPEVRIRFVTFVTREGDWGEVEGFQIALRGTVAGFRPPKDAVRIDLPDDMKWEEALRILAGIEREYLLGSLRIDPL